MEDNRFRRRSFLAVATSVVTAPMFSYEGSAENARVAKGQQPSLGFSLYGMKSLSLDVALQSCAEVGYSHVEFSLNAGYVTEPSAFSTESRTVAAMTLQKLKLGVPCLMVLMNLTADDKAHATNLKLIASAAQMGRELVPDRPPFLETILGGNPAK